MKLIKIVFGIMTLCANMVNSAMEYGNQMSSILIGLNKATEEKYDGQYLAEVRKLGEKYAAKRERVQQKHREWVSKIEEAARTKRSMDSLSSTWAYTSIDKERASIPLLHIIAQKSKCEELLRFMLDHGANPNLEVFLSRETPLAYAIVGRAYCNVRLLMARGADPQRLHDSMKDRIERDPELKRLIWVNQNH